MNKKIDVRKLAIIGVLGGISAVLGLTPLGFIPIGPTRATIMHIPVIIGAIMEGPLVGAFVGLIFGIFSVFQAITNPTPVSFVFLNPMVSILPRVLIGVFSFYAYDFLKRIGDKKHYFDLIIASIVGTLTNTIGVLTMIYIFFGERFVEALGLDPLSARKIILGIGLTNGIPETIISIIIVTAVVRGLRVIKRD